jgi:hypothetical protein
MNDTPRFIPARTLEGGTLVGTSYTNEFASCPYSWSNSYLRPHPDDPAAEAGIRPRFTSPYLLAGRTVHVGMAAWYASGVRGGEDTGARDIDRAIQEARVSHNSALHEYEDADRAEEDWQMTEVLLRSYHDRYGPTGAACEFPEVSVVLDGRDEPLIEREFKIQLGYRDYIFTSRPDAILNIRGMLRTRDHKTSVARFVGERREWTHWDPQFMGEALALTTLFPDEPLDGAEANILVKNRSPNSKFDVAEREVKRWSERDLWAYRLELIDILQQIDDRVGRYRLARSNGYDPETAACEVFPRHGTRTQACTAYGGCKYQTLCLHKEHTDSAMRQFKPRPTEERDAAQGRPY